MLSDIKITIESIFGHEYFLCFYGVILWYLILAGLESKFVKKPFVFREWYRRNLLDIVITLAIAPLMVVFDDEIINLYNDTIEDDIHLGPLVYLLAGPAYNILLRLITGFVKK